MRTLKESILSSTGTGKFVYKKQIDKGEFTPELIKMLENEVAYYKPNDSKDLINLVRTYIKFAGNNCSLNWIDVSEITDMSYMFMGTKFNGDISDWNVSNVTDMHGMFCNSKFNQNISKWDVSNVRDMGYMFDSSKFNQDISKWNVSKVKYMNWMFSNSKFNQNISDWDVSNVIDMTKMFCYSKKFNQDISRWNVKKVIKHLDIFYDCPIKTDYKPKFLY